MSSQQIVGFFLSDFCRLYIFSDFKFAHRLECQLSSRICMKLPPRSIAAGYTQSLNSLTFPLQPILCSHLSAIIDLQEHEKHLSRSFKVLLSEFAELQTLPCRGWLIVFTENNFKRCNFLKQEIALRGWYSVGVTFHSAWPLTRANCRWSYTSIYKRIVSKRAHMQPALCRTAAGLGFFWNVVQLYQSVKMFGQLPLLVSPQNGVKKKLNWSWCPVTEENSHSFTVCRLTSCCDSSPFKQQLN